MTRSPRSPGLIGPLRKRPAPSRILARPRALVALLITLLQVLGALHFALVPHSFSAALGGVVHVHGESALLGAPRAFARESANLALVADDAACIADLCPFADAPPSSAPQILAIAVGNASFGEPQLLSERRARTLAKWRVFLSAPKTSPPV